MKKMVLVVVTILLFALATVILAKPNLAIIWAVDTKNKTVKSGEVLQQELPGIDLNADRQKEKLVITTQFGTSQNWNTLLILQGKKTIMKIGFSSAGGIAVGYFLSKQKSQLIVWDYLAGEDEPHLGDHFYGIFVYDWNRRGELKPVYYYKTQRKYAYDFRVEKPLRELEQNKSHMIALTNLKRQAVSPTDRAILLREGLKWNKRRTKIYFAHQVAVWAFVRRGDPNVDWNAEFEVWEKKNGKWQLLAAGESGFHDAEEMYRDLGIPPTVWRKLWTFQ